MGGHQEAHRTVLAPLLQIRAKEAHRSFTRRMLHITGLSEDRGEVATWPPEEARDDPGLPARLFYFAPPKDIKGLQRKVLQYQLKGGGIADLGDWGEGDTELFAQLFETDAGDGRPSPPPTADAAR